MVRHFDTKTVSKSLLGNAASIHTDLVLPKDILIIDYMLQEYQDE